MQTISRYVAAFILALTSSYFGPSEAEQHEEKKAHTHIEIIKASPCIADVFNAVEQDSLG